jgi:hypothetical protein
VASLIMLIALRISLLVVVIIGELWADISIPASAEHTATCRVRYYLSRLNTVVYQSIWTLLNLNPGCFLHGYQMRIGGAADRATFLFIYYLQKFSTSMNRTVEYKIVSYSAQDFLRNRGQHLVFFRSDRGSAMFQWYQGIVWNREIKCSSWHVQFILLINTSAIQRSLNIPLQLIWI